MPDFNWDSDGFSDIEMSAQDELDYDSQDWEDDWCEPLPSSFCDGYSVHETHSYWAINGNVYMCSGLSEQQLADLEKYEDNVGECEHGLRSDICAGPGHYPSWM